MRHFAFPFPDCPADGCVMTPKKIRDLFQSIIVFHIGTIHPLSPQVTAFFANTFKQLFQKQSVNARPDPVLSPGIAGLLTGFRRLEVKKANLKKANREIGDPGKTSPVCYLWQERQE